MAVEDTQAINRAIFRTPKTTRPPFPRGGGGRARDGGRGRGKGTGPERGKGGMGARGGGEGKRGESSMQMSSPGQRKVEQCSVEKTRTQPVYKSFTTRQR